jgi:hypothetical protein
MDFDQHCLAHFSGIGFPHWSTNGHSRRFGEMRRDALVLTTQSARCQSGAKLLSLPKLSGCSAKPDGLDSPWRDYCSFPKAFQPFDTFCVSPLCTADD